MKNLSDALGQENIYKKNNFSSHQNLHIYNHFGDISIIHIYEKFFLTQL